MLLISKEDAGWIGRASFAGKKFNFVITVVPRVFKCFK